MADASLARDLFPKTLQKSSITAGRTRTYSAIALSDSSGGTVVVDMGGDTVSADGSQGIEVACSPSVRAGDVVVVTVVNGTPSITGNPGWGDSVEADAAAAAQAAAVAQTMASVASNAAAEAVEDAAEAKTAADAAQASADAAAEDATTAKASAQAAVADAALAKTSAQNAVDEAESAKLNAQSAWTEAVAAKSSAQAATAEAAAAKSSAQAASTAAANAQSEASAATSSAATANTAANNALTNLSLVQDIVDTLETDVDDLKTHVALANDGLYVLADDSGYKYRVSATDARIIDDTGNTVSLSNEDGTSYYDSTGSQTASFGPDGAQVGKSSSTHVNIASSGFFLRDAQNNAITELSPNGYRLGSQNAGHIFSGYHLLVEKAQRIGMTTYTEQAQYSDLILSDNTDPQVELFSDNGYDMVDNDRGMRIYDNDGNSAFALYCATPGDTSPLSTRVKVVTEAGTEIDISDPGSWRSALEITPANIGAAASSHTHSASDVASGTLASARLPTVPVSKGGTNATTVADARNNLYFGAVQLGGTSGGRQSVTATMTSNNAAFVLQRGTTKAIMLVDLWTASPAIFGNLPAEVVLVRGAASGSSGEWTIQNNTGSALVVEALGAKFGEVQDNTAAMTENVTRTVMDDFVPSTGGSFSGNVVHEASNVYVDDGSIISGTTPSANQYGNAVYFRDSRNTTIGCINTAYYTNGRQALRFLTQRVHNGSTLYHSLVLWIDDDGNRGVTTDDAVAWRTGIGAAASSHTHSADDVSSGTLAAARLPTITASKGGTGRTTLTSNALIAGNGTGQVKQIATASGALYATAANGEPQFGALPVAQGGTGATDAAGARTALGVTAANIGLGGTGNTNSKSQSTDVSVASSTTTNLCSVTLAAGTWLIWGRAAFSANASGARVAGIYTSATANNTGITHGATKAAPSASGITLLPTGPLLVTPTANTTYYLNVWQNSGANLNCTGRIEAVRVK